jgi:hypothetical protein
MLDFFLIDFLPKVLHLLFVWCIFHTGVCLPKTVITFLTVCPKQFILVILYWFCLFLYLDNHRVFAETFGLSFSIR